MVDNIKFNHILPSLSPAGKIKRTDPRGRNNQQTPFKESLERKQKNKKKDSPGHDGERDNEVTLGAIPLRPPADLKRADRCSQSRESARSKLIDIRV